MTTNSAELKRLGYELDGVIYDATHNGFDDVCLDTVKRVRAALAEFAADAGRTAAQGEQAGSAEQVSEREHFEKWAAPYGYSLELASCGCCAYQSEDTQNAYMGYSAALSAPERKQGEQAAPEFNTKEPK